MNWNQVKQEWPWVQSKVKRTWGRIDEADLAMIHGERDSFTRILAQRYGYELAIAQQKLDAFVERLEPESESRIIHPWFSRQLQKCWGYIHTSLRR